MYWFPCFSTQKQVTEALTRFCLAQSHFLLHSSFLTNRRWSSSLFLTRFAQMADNIATFIDKLLSVNDFNNPSLTYCVKEHEITKIIQKCTDIVLKQPVMLEIEAPAKVCGDIHGQYWDLLRLFNTCGYPPDHTYLFLGDYVDRGKQGLEVICLLMAYKVHYPEAFFLLRGNHETSSINRIYGFYDECKRRYSVALYNSFQGLFNSLPLCALVGQRIFAMHGGLSPYLSNWDQLTDSVIKRPFDPPHRSLPTDLLWSDPEQGVKGWDKNTRGVSFVFGVDVVKDFCAKMDVDLIVRGHQVVQDGYEFFANKMLVTVFSAPKYCGDFDNNAAVMFINEDLECTFEIILPRNSNPKIRAPLKKKRSKRSKRADSEDDNSTKTSNK